MHGGKGKLWRSLALATGLFGVIAGVGAGAATPASAEGRSVVFDLGDLPTRSNVSIDEFFSPLLGNFAGSKFDDVFDWAPGTATADSLAIANGDRTFTTVPQTITGSFQPFVGNFGGDSHDDIFWYGPGTAPDSLWISKGNGSWTKARVEVNGSYAPVVGNFDGTGNDEVLWYGFGSTPDSIWTFSASGGLHTSRTLTINGAYRPIVADVNDGADGHHGDDIIWETVPTDGADNLWVSTNSGFSSRRLTLRPPADDEYGDVSHFLVGRFGGDGHDDLFVYGPGAIADRLVFGAASGLVNGPAVSVKGDYVPIVGNWNGVGDSIFWGSHGGGPDRVWYGNNTGTFTHVDDPAHFPPGAPRVPRLAYDADTRGVDRFNFGDDPGTTTEDAVVSALQSDGVHIRSAILYGHSPSD